MVLSSANGSFYQNGVLPPAVRSTIITIVATHELISVVRLDPVLQHEEIVQALSNWIINIQPSINAVSCCYINEGLNINMAESIEDPFDRNLQLQAALQNLRKSEIELAKAEAQCSKLEAIIQKQLKLQSSGLAEAKSKSEISSNRERTKKTTRTIYTKTASKIQRSDRKNTLLNKGNSCRSQKTAERNGDLAKKSNDGDHNNQEISGGEGDLCKGNRNIVKGSTISVSRKTSNDICKAYTSAEKLGKDQVQTRIRQYHENLNSIATINAKPIPQKASFLRRLHKMNSDAWKSQKLMNSSLTKLEQQMNSSH